MSYKSTLFLLGAALLSSQLLSAQTKREILVEDPKEAPDVRLELAPINAYSSDQNSTFNWSVGAVYRVKNKFSISGEFRKEYFDFEDENIRYGNGSSYTYGKPYAGSAYEVMGTYYFATNEKEKEDWMPVKSRYTGYRTVEVTVDPLPVTRLALYGLRVGFASSKSTNNFGAMNLYEDGKASNVITGESATALQQTKIAFAGLSITHIKNMKVRYPVYGIRRKQYIREYYLDALYATSNTFGTLTATDGSGVVYRVDPSTPLLKYGARIGLTSIPSGKLVNVGYGFELGAFPGSENFSSGFYGHIKVIIALCKKMGAAEE